LIYLDTSVLAAYYCPEPLSDRAERIVRSATSPALSELTELELLSALSRKVRARELSAADATRIMGRFTAHVAAGMFQRVVLDHRHFDLARGWMGRLTLSLRTLDTLHLAIASAEALPIATFDRALLRIATVLGVDTVETT